MSFTGKTFSGSINEGPDEFSTATGGLPKRAGSSLQPPAQKSGWFAGRRDSKPAPTTPLQDEALDKIRADFLQDLDLSTTIEVSDFEADFLSSNLSRKSFSPGQRKVIDKMRKKFERHL